MAAVLREVSLDDKYLSHSGRIFLTGTQALVCLAIMQRERDLAAGLNSAGFISGYRGSPLGTFDVLGCTGQRRTERALIGEYEQLVAKLLDGLNDGN
jgi:hypothetical protein